MPQSTPVLATLLQHLLLNQLISAAPCRFSACLSVACLPPAACLSACKTSPLPRRAWSMGKKESPPASGSARRRAAASPAPPTTPKRPPAPRRSSTIAPLCSGLRPAAQCAPRPASLLGQVRWGFRFRRLAGALGLPTLTTAGVHCCKTALMLMSLTSLRFPLMLSCSTMMGLLMWAQLRAGAC
jgi:hypothetical protein